MFISFLIITVIVFVVSHSICTQAYRKLQYHWLHCKYKIFQLSHYFVGIFIDYLIKKKMMRTIQEKSHELHMWLVSWFIHQICTIYQVCHMAFFIWFIQSSFLDVIFTHSSFMLIHDSFFLFSCDFTRLIYLIHLFSRDFYAWIISLIHMICLFSHAIFMHDSFIWFMWLIYFHIQFSW